MRSVCGTLLLALVLMPLSARAGTEACLIQVDGKTYVNKPCNVDRQPGGSLSVNTGSDKSIKFFAYISPDDGGATASGWWNKDAGASHAHTSLGDLSFRDGCWVNARAKVCAQKGPSLALGTSATGSAETFVKKLYAPYFDPNHNKQPMPELGQFLEPSLLILWRRSERKWKRLASPGGPTTSGDWVCDCQDGDMSNLQLATLRSDENEAAVMASFKMDGDERKIRYDLRSYNGRWLVKDMVIISRSQSLKRDLVKDSHSASE